MHPYNLLKSLLNCGRKYKSFKIMALRPLILIINLLTYIPYKLIFRIMKIGQEKLICLIIHFKRPY